MKRIVLLAAVLILALAAMARAESDAVYGNAVCKFLKNCDGDTLTVNIPDWPDIVGKKISIRIFGIDTPELRGTSGRTKELARNAKRLTENLCRNAVKLELRNIRRDKYFRLLAEVYADDKNVADILVKNGLARPYYGGKKEVWE
ncbi:MAG: thermonuclease family protein [Desulfococcaceae bacterium]